MTPITTTVSANDVLKLTTNGSSYWFYSISGTNTEISVKTNLTPFIPHKNKSGIKFKSEFTELLLKNETGSPVDIVLIVGFDEYIDYS